MASPSPSTILAITIALAYLTIDTTKTQVSGQLTHEECFRIQIYGHLSAPEGDQRARYIQNMRDKYCRSLGRGFYYAWRHGRTGRLPVAYVEALCNVFEDDRKVADYVRSSFESHDVDRLMGGRTCEGMRNKTGRSEVPRTEMTVVVLKREEERPGRRWPSKLVMVLKRTKTMALNYVLGVNL